MVLNQQIRTNYELYSKATESMPRLLLPPAPLMLRKGQKTKEFDVYDPQRGRWLALTPEEWVRQHFVSYMIDILGYPHYRVANEVSLKFNRMQRRADTVVYDDVVKPLAIIEYKEPGTALTREVLEQALRYNQVFEAPGLTITNGVNVYSALGGKIWQGVITFDKLSEYAKTAKK